MDTDIADNSYSFNFYWLDYSARDALSLLTSYIGYAHKEKRWGKRNFGLFFLTCIVKRMIVLQFPHLSCGSNCFDCSPPVFSGYEVQ